MRAFPRRRSRLLVGMGWAILFPHRPVMAQDQPRRSQDRSLWTTVDKNEPFAREAQGRHHIILEDHHDPHSLLFVAQNEEPTTEGTHSSSSREPDDRIQVRKEAPKDVTLESSIKSRDGRRRPITSSRFRLPTLPPPPVPTPRPTLRPRKDLFSPVRNNRPSRRQRKLPTPQPHVKDSTTQHQEEQQITYQPGDFSQEKTSDDGLVRLSNGLSATRIAKAGQLVSFFNGKTSSVAFHGMPDGAAVVPRNNGGWWYVSNAELDDPGGQWWNGGVGVLRFSPEGNVTGYQRVGDGLARNCGGGRTPWNSWVTCEERTGGRVYQVDPTGRRPPQLTAMGSLGWYESFAYDDSSLGGPTFYVTSDQARGPLTRFTPNEEGMNCWRAVRETDRWCTLEHGSRDYLQLLGSSSTGTFLWTQNMTAAQQSAAQDFPFGEGIDVVNGMLYFISKAKRRLVILNLVDMTYEYTSTKSGAFNQQPDQVARLVKEGDNGNQSILYLCEDGGRHPGVHGRDAQGRYFEILFGIDSLITHNEETTGLAFSPDGLHMYVSFQKTGNIYSVTRDDGRRFDGASLDIKYHAMTS